MSSLWLARRSIRASEHRQHAPWTRARVRASDLTYVEDRRDGTGKPNSLKGAEDKMSANTEQTVFARGLPAWHGTGTVLPDSAMDFETIVRHVPQIDMGVNPRPLVYLEDDFQERVLDVMRGSGANQALRYVFDQLAAGQVPDQVANVRDDGTYLGIVGDGYQRVQGRQAFEFLSELLKPNGAGLREVIADTAGTLDGGRKMFIACRASRVFYIAGQSSEEHKGFMTFLNSFDGSTPVGAVISTTRTVCENTFNANLTNNQASYWFKHTTNVGDRVAEARQALSVAGRYWTEYEDKMNKLVRVKWSDQDWQNFLDAGIVADPKTLEAAGKKRAAENAQREREELTMLWVNAPDVQNVRGTAYAALQACTAWSDHCVRGRKSERSSVAENRTRRILLDASFKDKAYKVISGMAEVR